MGFRLSSAIAGFAERTSENLTALQDKADEITKTAAATYAQEALQVRKERMKSRREYLSAAEDLSGMGLNNNQIETILKGGIKNADLFKQTLQDAEAKANDAGQEFDRGVAISAMFTGEEQGDGRAIAKQAELYAQKMFGFVKPDTDAIANSAAEATQTLFGNVDKKYTVSQFNAQMKALGGATPITYDENAGYGQTGLSHNLGGLSYEKALTYKTANLQNKKLLGDINEQVGEQEYLKLLRPLDLKRTRKLLEGLDTQEKLNQANLQKAGYENIELKRKNANYFKELRKKEKIDDLTLKTAKIQLKQITKDLYSPQVNPSQVWGSLLAQKNSILNGEMEFKSEEVKETTLKELEKQITYAAVQTEAYYDYQKGDDKDFYGLTAFEGFYDNLVEQAEEDVGIKTGAGGTKSIRVGERTFVKGIDDGYNIYAKQAEKNAQQQFKEQFSTNGVPDNDAIGSIIKGFGKTAEDKAEETSTSTGLSFEDTVNALVTDDRFSLTESNLKKNVRLMLKDFPDKEPQELLNNLVTAYNNIPAQQELELDFSSINNLQQENPIINKAVSDISANKYTGGTFEGQIREVADYNRADNKPKAYENLALRIANKYFNVGTQSYDSIPTEVLSQIKLVISKLGISES